MNTSYFCLRLFHQLLLFVQPFASFDNVLHFCFCVPCQLHELPFLFLCFCLLSLSFSCCFHPDNSILQYQYYSCMQYQHTAYSSCFPFVNTESLRTQRMFDRIVRGTEQSKILSSLSLSRSVIIFIRLSVSFCTCLPVSFSFYVCL